MNPKSLEEESKIGGEYEVTESGIHFRHGGEGPTCQNAQEFLKNLRDGLKMNILEEPSENELIFEISGIDVSFANALRRIMIAEVPTVAIEHVYFWNNSSIVHDEVLAHRIGLIPLNCDARLFDTYVDSPTDRNTLVFLLSVKCGKSKEADEKAEKKRQELERGSNNMEEDKEDTDESVMGNTELDTAAKEAVHLYRAANTNAAKIVEEIESSDRPYTRHVYSKDLKWSPQGDQINRFPDGIRPVHEDILLAKMRPGQTIDFEAHARKGTGSDHAKFSPVATAAYRLMPKIELVKPVYDKLAEELANLYEPGVFKLVPCDSNDPPGTTIKAKVDNPYACTMSRNYMRNEELKNSVKVTRIPNHFIFSIESVGMMKPNVILGQALQILIEKCQNLMRQLDDQMEVDELNNELNT